MGSPAQYSSLPPPRASRGGVSLARAAHSATGVEPWQLLGPERGHELSACQASLSDLSARRQQSANDHIPKTSRRDFQFKEYGALHYLGPLTEP